MKNLLSGIFFIIAGLCFLPAEAAESTVTVDVDISIETPVEECFVVRSGNKLLLNGKQFYFNGTNNDHPYHWSHFMIDDILTDAKDLGLTVFRTWASSEGQGSLSNHGYCFQPNPGEYSEAAFQQMDYIIAKAKEKGLRLILPLVNNWDDGYGGMPQYVKWAVGDPGNWSGKTVLTFDLYNAGDATTADIALRTGPNWTWYESSPLVLVPGWNYNLSVDLTAANWKSEATNWEYTGTVGNLDQVRTLGIGLFGYWHPGAAYIDNLRMDSALYDGLEKKDNWYAADYSYAGNVEASSDYVSEGAYSLKMAYSYSYGEYNNKAFVEKQPQVDKNIFFTNARCKELYKNYINYFLNRVNTYTGKAYKDDPTIMIWELANEPRCESDPSGNTLQSWINEMAGYIKSIDPKHLVSTGEEGWYCVAGNSDWKYDGRLGTDYTRNHRSPYIDVCSFHMYPEGYGMSDQDTFTWINQHVDDALNTIGKPVYLGEFGITADRRAKILNSFDTDVEGWVVDWNYSQGPEHVESPSYDGNGAIRYIAAINEANSSCAGRVVYTYPPGVDYSFCDYLCGWVYLPAGAPADLTAEMYTHSGEGWKWNNGRNTALVPGAWTKVELAKSWIQNGGGDVTKVRTLGIQIKRGNTDYYGEVYYDLTGTNLKGMYDGAYQMARRDQLYTDWFNLLDVKGANGAAFWQIFARQDDGTLYPDYWNWGVYYPEDTQTSAIIQNFSLKMKNKGSDPTPPTTPQVTDVGAYAPSKTQLFASWSSLDAESGISEYQYRITRDFPTGTVIRDWTSTGTYNYVTAGTLSLQDGRRYYFGVKAKNGSGVESGIGYSDGIYVDSLLPSGTVRVNGNVAYANSATVALMLSASDRGGSGPDQMRLSNDNITYSTPEKYAVNKTWTLSLGDGVKNVYAKFSDKAGNWSGPCSDSIILDTGKPAITQIFDAPDPFDPERRQRLKINYTLSDNLSSSLDVSVYIYNSAGSLVKTLRQPLQSPGARAANWDGRGPSNSYVPDGKYRYRIKAQDKAGNYTYSDDYYVTKI